MTKRCGSYGGNGECGLDWQDEDARPSSCDDDNLCLDEGWDCGCTEFFEDDEDVCDYCGEPLGFCAIDCETLEEGFEDD